MVTNLFYVKHFVSTLSQNPEWKKMFGAEEMESSPPKLLIADDHSAVIEADVGKKPSVLPGVSVSRQISGSQVQLATQSASTVELRTPEVKSSETGACRFLVSCVIQCVCRFYAEVILMSPVSWLSELCPCCRLF